MIKTADLTPRQKKIAIILVSIIVIYALSGFLGAPFIVRSILEKQVAEAINRKITVGNVRVNPITLSVTLIDLAIRDVGGAPFVNLDEAYANLQTSSVFKWALVLKSLRVVNPQISLVRSGKAQFNFSDIGKGGAPEAAHAETSAGGGFALAIYETQITGGRISMDDRVVSVAHQIDDLNLSLSDLSSRPADVDVTTLFNLAARVNGAALSLKGKSRPFGSARETKVELGIEDLNVPHYLSYLTLPEGLVIQSLTLETETEVDFRMLEGDQPELVVAGLFALIDARLVHGNGDPFVSYPRLELDLLPSKVLAGQFRLAQVEMSAPEYFLKRLPSGDLYLPFLAVKAYDEAETKAAEDTSGEFQPLVTIDTLNLKKGVLHFTDLSNSDAFTTTISDLNLELNNLGINSDRTAAYRLSLETEVDESVNLSGTVSFAPLNLSGVIEVSHVQVSRYVPYYKDIFDFKTVEGKVSLGGNYRFREEDNGPLVRLADVHLDLQTLKVVDEDDDDPLISIDHLRVTDTTAELVRREVTLGHLAISNANFSCLREKDGALNIVRVFVPQFASEAPATNRTAAPEDDPTAQSAATTEPFVVNLKALDISGLAVDVEDRVPEEPVKLRLDDIRLTAANLSTAPGSAGKADLSLRWEQGGQVQIGGDITIEPLALDMSVRANEIDVRPFQPYLSEQAGLIVTQGFFSTKGRMGLSRKQAADPAISYSGKVELNRFASIDRKNANDFLKWEALLLDNVEVGINPTRLSIDQISLADFFARVIVDPDGSVNLVSMFTRPEGSQVIQNEKNSSPEPANGKTNQTGLAVTPPPIRIARVTLSGGDVDFSDRFVKPNFNAKFHDLGGRVSGLESIDEKRADVLMEGMWSNHAPVKITGQINPLIENPYVDLNLNISDIELSPFSPYSGKYLGYILEKGKLTFNLTYLMEDGKLKGANSVYIDQLTLGDTVDSPEAVSLPVKLAVALLKDREGNIELDLPVSGNMDDPEFKIGKVVLTVLKNLIVKIVSSPFAALGALAGGGEELSYLDFDAGIIEINQENAEKMDKLATILYERPGLKLDVQGAAAPEWDEDALRVTLVENRLKAEKLRRMMKSGQSAVPLEAIVLSEADRPVLLEAVFVDSGIRVPVDDSGKPVELTEATMEMLLRTHTAVSDDDYRQLANARAFNAKNYLLEKGQVERQRVFIVAPQTGTTDQEQADGAGGRVVFSLK